MGCPAIPWRFLTDCEEGVNVAVSARATFSFPNDIAVSPDGKTLYVNENGSTTKPHTELAPIVVRRIRLVGGER